MSLMGLVVLEKVILVELAPPPPPPSRLLPPHIIHMIIRPAASPSWAGVGPFRRPSPSPLTLLRAGPAWDWGPPGLRSACWGLQVFIQWA